MNTTSATLLVRLRSRTDQEAWKRFVELYTPLLFFWGKRAGLSEADAADLAQDVLGHLVDKIGQFEHPAEGSKEVKFRAWLRTVTLNKWRERTRRKTPETLAASDLNWREPAAPAEAETLWQEEHNRYLVQRALQVMRNEFSPEHFQACWETTVNGRKAAEVAAELGLSEGAVYVAKSRVFMRLREELAGLWED